MFKGKATSSSSGGEGFEIPPAGNLPAVMIGIIDLGTQDISYNGEQDQAHKILLLWELTGEPMSGTKGRNHVICRDYRMSCHVKSKLRQIYEAWNGKKYGDDEEIDYTTRIGHPCLLTIVHGVSGNGNSYAKVDTCGPLPKGMPVSPPTLQPFAWSISEGLMLFDRGTKKLEPTQNADLPEWSWLPFLYGKSVHDTIKQSDEWKALMGNGGNANSGKSAPANSNSSTGSTKQPEHAAAGPSGGDTPPWM